jgi:hypothetical protein
LSSKKEIAVRRYLPFIFIALSVLIIAVGIVMLMRPDTTPATSAQPPAAAPTALAASSAPASESEVARVSVEELQQQLDSDNPPLVWDVRGAESYSQQHIPGSRQVDLGDVEATAAGLDRNQPIVTLCA